MMKPDPSNGGRLARPSYAIPILFIFAAASLLHADVTITSGDVGWSTNGTSSVQIQGQGFSLSGYDPNFQTLHAGASDFAPVPTNVNFTVTQSLVYPPANPGSGATPLTLVYNETTYSNYVVLSLNLTGGVVTVPNGQAPHNVDSYSGSVRSIPFSMSGTVAVHSGSYTGPVILTVPISGSGGYGADILFASSGGSPPFLAGGASYSFTTGPWLGSEARTQGAWSGEYGADGYLIANGISSLPSYASVTTPGDTAYTWSGQTTDQRALQNGPGSSTRVASAYTQYPNNNLVFNVGFTDGYTHRVALYLLDFDSTTRVETITVTDAATNTVLDAETFSNFNAGIYAAWNLQGSVVITVTPATGTTPVASGIFFGYPEASGIVLNSLPTAGTAGSSTSTTVYSELTNGLQAPVTLSTSAWPSGITGSFSAMSPTTLSSELSINIGAGVAPGTYNLLVNGTAGSLAASTTISLTVHSSAASFTLTPGSAAILPGGSGTAMITVFSVNGFNLATNPVTLAASNWPAGITGTFGPNPMTGSSTVTIHVPANVPLAGSYTLPVVGTSGSLTASTTITLNLIVSGFSLTATRVTVDPGSSSTSTVTIIPQSWFNSLVTFSFGGFQAGFSGSMTQNGTTATLTVNADPSTPAGTYSIMVTGSSVGSYLGASVTIPVTVTAKPAFSLAFAAPRMASGSSVSTVVYVTPFNGFNGPVTLSASGLPTGMTATLGTNPATLSSVLTFTASPSLLGAYQIAVTGTSGSITYTYNTAISVTNLPGYTLAAAPVTIPAGGSGSSAITITPFNGFTGTVGLGYLVSWPTGITANFMGSSVQISVASSVAAGTYLLRVGASNSLQYADVFISLTVTSNAPPASPVNYIGLDTATQGAWSGKYGGDGFQIANGAINLPSYASVNVTGASAYTWAQQISDPRALQSGQGSTTGLAASYYGNSFNINVNLTDFNSHQVALYLLDFDTTSRSEKITVLDAATNAVLDQESFTGFHNGQWAVWNIKGNVIIQVTSQGGGNAVVSGIFFGPAAAPQPGFTLTATPATPVQSAWSSTITVVPTNGFNQGVTLTAANWPTGITGSFGTNPTTGTSTVTINVNSSVAPGPYSLTVNGSANTLVASTTISLTVPGSTPQPSFTLTAAAATAAAGSSATSTVTVAPANGFNSPVTFSASSWPAGITLDQVQNSVVTVNVASSIVPGPYSLTLLGTSGTLSANTTIALTVTAPAFGNGPTASFAGTDTTTQGAWNTKYGASGYMIANGPSLSSFNASGTLIGNSTYTWAGQTSDPRALVLPGTFNGIASAYTQYPATGFSIHVQTNGTVPVTLYLLDWDSTSRSETISIVDAATNTALDTETFSGFHNGQYATWNVRGNVIIKVTPNGSSSPVVSGVFFN